MKHKLTILIILISTSKAFSQSDSLFSKLSYEMDYRFRAEQDWDSRKSDGTYRDDRSRLRYRLRAGATYSSNEYSFGLRIRTGYQRKQQDPQLTLGKGLKEFGTLPIGFEKTYFQYNKHNFKIWVGKNTYPFKKNNELFWSDNIFPEGIAINKMFNLKKGILKDINLIVSHFIIGSNNKTFLDDAYFQGAQINLNSRKNKFEFASALYRLNNIPNIPDGGHTFEIQYSIIHIRSKFNLASFSFDIDYYKNLNRYNNNINIQEEFRNQNAGYSVGIQYGQIKSAIKWMYKLTYTYLERYSILDYMSQNDWARWDYSSSNSPDGRLSNYKGIEAVIAYAVTKKINLVSKYYLVEQLIPFGTAKENGQRIRFDINVKI